MTKGVIQNDYRIFFWFETDFMRPYCGRWVSKKIWKKINQKNYFFHCRHKLRATLRLCISVKFRVFLVEIFELFSIIWKWYKREIQDGDCKLWRWFFVNAWTEWKSWQSSNEKPFRNIYFVKNLKPLRW